jgi:hypothetical protein
MVFNLLISGLFVCFQKGLRAGEDSKILDSENRRGDNLNSKMKRALGQGGVEISRQMRNESRGKWSLGSCGRILSKLV